MPIVVETGSGLPNADSYVSVAEADTYHLAFTSGTAWSSATTTDKERALRVATQFIDTRYGPRFQGRRVDLQQSLQWPRAWVTDNDGFDIASDVVPTKVRHATCELARRALSADLVTDSKTGEIRRTLVEIGPIKKEVEYESGQSEQVLYTIVEDLLFPLLQPREIERA